MAEKLLRFKDVLSIEGFGSLKNPNKLSFKDMHVTQYRPGEDELTNYRAYRRRRVNSVSEEKDVDEALTVTQRLARKRQMRKLLPKIRIGRERAKRRIASKEKLELRARRQARMMLFKKFTKDIPKGYLTYARRAEIEKRLEKPAIKKRIEQIARKMLPKVRRAELDKKRASRND